MISRFTDVMCVTPTITAGQSYIMDLTLGNIFCWGVTRLGLHNSTTGGVRLRPNPLLYGKGWTYAGGMSKGIGKADRADSTSGTPNP